MSDSGTQHSGSVQRAGAWCQACACAGLGPTAWGVADGVYMWRDEGIDAGELARTLMASASDAVSGGMRDVLHGGPCLALPMALLQQGCPLPRLWSRVCALWGSGGAVLGQGWLAPDCMRQPPLSVPAAVRACETRTPGSEGGLCLCSPAAANAQSLQQGCKGSSTCCIIVVDLLQVSPADPCGCLELPACAVCMRAPAAAAPTARPLGHALRLLACNAGLPPTCALLPLT